MSIIEHKTLRNRATDQEALAERARKLVAGPANGIKLVFVSVGSNEATLEVEFYNRNFLQTIVDKFDAESPTDSSIARRIFPISGGHRLQAGAAAGHASPPKTLE